MNTDVLAGLMAELPEGMVVTDPAVTDGYRKTGPLTLRPANRWQSSGHGAPKRCRRCCVGPVRTRCPW
ncbi:oxidoreductase [Mycobacterium tuberculosis]|nr:oxidoreductase [Mycobacterium tuberculosis]